MKLGAFVRPIYNSKRQSCVEIQISYFSIDNASVIYKKKKAQFVKNEHARYTLRHAR
jgi:hypothetical protein